MKFVTEAGSGKTGLFLKDESKSSQHFIQETEQDERPARMVGIILNSETGRPLGQDAPGQVPEQVWLHRRKGA